MASAQEVQDELLGANPPAGHHDTVMHENGPSFLRHVAKTVQDKLSHAAHEVTLWLPRRTIGDNDLGIDKPNKVDTTLGHAIDAASFGRLNYLILKRLADKLDVDISDIR
jgi:hypothetical protein